MSSQISDFSSCFPIEPDLAQSEDLGDSEIGRSVRKFMSIESSVAALLALLPGLAVDPGDSEEFGGARPMESNPFEAESVDRLLLNQAMLIGKIWKQHCNEAAEWIRVQASRSINLSAKDPCFIIAYVWHGLTSERDSHHKHKHMI